MSQLTYANEAGDLAHKLLDTLHQPYLIGKRELTISASLGIALYPNNSGSAEELMRNADTAMYKAKERGPNNFQFYNKTLNQHSLERLDLENELVTALSNNEFLLFYQPEFNLKTGALDCFEALIRWNHPVKGLLSPNKFISTAEENGLILQIGEWVLKTACETNKKWQEKGFPRVRVAVNVAGSQFAQRQDLVAMVKETLDKTGLDPGFLEIELSENIVINNGEIIQTVRALKNLGVSLALDDFGTGFSNLSYLKKLPVDHVKIDAAYTLNINENLDDEAIIRAIIAMAKSLNLTVIAEGIETVEQLDFLIKEGCDIGQGFYFSKPIPVEQVGDFLKSYQSFLPKRHNDDDYSTD
jgi:EAL domain-containing protein (putative c-di-GMP-specific phosphodiesterase class I)